MILTCSHCNTQFSINAGALGTRGRKVKCSRCSHSWFQQPETPPPPTVTPEPMAVQDMPPPVTPEVVSRLDREPVAAANANEFVDAPIVRKQAAPALKIASVFLFIFAIFSGGLFGVPKMKIAAMEKAQEIMGLADMSGFALQGIGIEKIPSESNPGKMTLAFSGVLKNNFAVTKSSPVLKVILYDRGGREVRALEYKFPVEKVEAGKTIPFDPKIKNIPDSLSRVVLDLGNPVEQMLR